MLHQENIKITMVRGGSKWRDKNFIFFLGGTNIIIYIFNHFFSTKIWKKERRKNLFFGGWGGGLYCLVMARLWSLFCCLYLSCDSLSSFFHFCKCMSRFSVHIATYIVKLLSNLGIQLLLKLFMHRHDSDKQNEDKNVLRDSKTYSW